MNTDESLETAKNYSISGLPSLLVFKDGKAVEIRNGLYAEARLKPAADTGNLRFVTILIRTATARSNSR